MSWDLGPYGLAVLLAMSLAFGAIAQLVTWRSATHWMWLVAATVYFAAGLFVSEVIFGWATAAELQPNIDGLSFDEAMLFSLIPGLIAVAATWYLTRSERHATAH